MKIYGKILETIVEDRIIKMSYKKRIIYVYMSRKMFKDFGPYFYNKPYVFLLTTDKKRIQSGKSVYDATMFIKVIRPSLRERKVFYDILTIKRGVKKLLNKTKNKMFLDLEFTLPSFYQTMPHIPEIIQYGLVIEDDKGNVIFEDSALLKPYRKYAINARTMQFLSRKREDFNDALPYEHFYEVLNKCIKDYNVKIVAWGKSDMLALEQSFKLNKVKPLNIRKRYINLMQVIKNYNNQKDEMGLFQTFQEMSGKLLEPQQHDALEDAVVTLEIYRMFKDKVNSETK